MLSGRSGRRRLDSRRSSRSATEQGQLSAASRPLGLHGTVRELPLGHHAEQRGANRFQLLLESLWPTPARMACAGPPSPRRPFRTLQLRQRSSLLRICQFEPCCDGVGGQHRRSRRADRQERPALLFGLASNAGLASVKESQRRPRWPLRGYQYLRSATSGGCLAWPCTKPSSHRLDDFH